MGSKKGVTLQFCRHYQIFAHFQTKMGVLSMSEPLCCGIKENGHKDISSCLVRGPFSLWQYFTQWLWGLLSSLVSYKYKYLLFRCVHNRQISSLHFVKVYPIASFDNMEWTQENLLLGQTTKKLQIWTIVLFRYGCRQTTNKI